MKYFKTYLPFYRRNFKVAVPIMLAQAGQMSVQLVDSIMVGRFGTAELAASSFASSVYIIGFVFGMGFNLGITPLIGEAFGNNNDKRVGRLSINFLVLNVIVASLLSLLLYYISFAMPYMGQVDSVVRLAIPYYKILVYSIVPMLVFFIFKQILEGFGNTKAATLITLLSNLLNVILNYIFIFGHCGFEPMGLEGAGWASFIARVFMALVIIIYVYKSSYFKRFIPHIHFNKIEIKELIRLFKFNLPIGLQMIIEVVAFSVGSLMAGWFGEIALAAHQVALGLSSFTFMIASGIGSAATIRVSHQLGAKKYRELRLAGFSSIHLAIAFMSCTALSFIFFNRELASLFTTDPKVIYLASNLLLFAAIFQILDGIQVVSISILRGLQDVNFTLIFSILSYGVFSLSCSYLLSTVFEYGVRGVWIGYILGLLLSGIIFALRFNKLSIKMLNKG